MHQKTVFDNGVRVITERLPFATASLGIWIDTGSRDENEREAGYAHFVEHMLFKGTVSRSAQQIAREFDSLGGMSNAFTSKETTCVYATVLGRHVNRLADILADMVFNSVFDQKEIVREQHVILQEISMVEDTPDDQIHDLFASLIWPEHPLGRDVLGTRESVASTDSARLKTFIKNNYIADRILIAAAGDVDHQQICDLFADKLDTLSPQVGERPKRSGPRRVAPASQLLTKPLEQVHLLTGTHALSANSIQRYTLQLLNIILGGNMSSRLFQEVREKHGLAYSIYSYLSPHVDSGYLGIYLGVNERSVSKAITLIKKELAKLWEDAIPALELTNAKEYATGTLHLAAENMEARMTRLASNEFVFGRHLSLEEVVENMEKVTALEIAALAEDLFFSKGLSIAIIGPAENYGIDWELDH